MVLRDRDAAADGTYEERRDVLQNRHAHVRSIIEISGIDDLDAGDFATDFANEHPSGDMDRNGHWKAASVMCSALPNSCCRDVGRPSPDVPAAYRAGKPTCTARTRTENVMQYLQVLCFLMMCVTMTCCSSNKNSTHTDKVQETNQQDTQKSLVADIAPQRPRATPTYLLTHPPRLVTLTGEPSAATRWSAAHAHKSIYKHTNIRTTWSFSNVKAIGIRSTYLAVNVAGDKNGQFVRYPGLVIDSDDGNVATRIAAEDSEIVPESSSANYFVLNNHGNYVVCARKDKAIVYMPDGLVGMIVNDEGYWVGVTPKHVMTGRIDDAGANGKICGVRNLGDAANPNIRSERSQQLHWIDDAGLSFVVPGIIVDATAGVIKETWAGVWQLHGWTSMSSSNACVVYEQTADGKRVSQELFVVTRLASGEIARKPIPVWSGRGEGGGPLRLAMLSRDLRYSVYASKRRSLLPGGDFWRYKVIDNEKGREITRLVRDGETPIGWRGIDEESDGM